MLKQNLITWLGFLLTSILATAGCTQGGRSESSGALDLNLELASGAQIDEVLYQITGNGMPPMGGIIDTRAPGATASVEVFGLPEGGGYLIELRAVSAGSVVCEGSASFGVVADRATPVAVMLNCNPRERFGSVRVNGELNVCAELTKVVVSPLETSVGSRIDLSMLGEDAEGDPIEYFWAASDGSILNPDSADTSYACVSPGRQLIQAFVSDDEFGDCIDTWQVEVRCGSGDGGTGGTAGGGGTAGSGGSSGSGGTAGTGGGPSCVPTDPRCLNGPIDPIIENPACVLREPPFLADRCSGVESLINPATCTPTGIESLHQVQLIEVNGDCNAGFDLDSCAGESCNMGGLAPGEGMDGVDNALAGLAPVLVNVGGNLGGVDQALYDGLCNGTIDWAYLVDPNPAENCANMTPVYGGVPGATIPVNLSDTGCVSGELGTIPIPVAGVQGELGNTVFRATADVAKGFTMTVGATVADDTARAIADALIDGGSAVVSQVFDISADLERDVWSSCDALSLTLDVGATRIASTTEGACTGESNAMVYANLEYTDPNGKMFTGVEAAEEIGQDCLFGSTVSDPTLEGCRDETGATLSCYPNCPASVLAALGECVAGCSQDAIAEASPPGLSGSCTECMGERVACNSAFCVAPCVADTTSPECVQCQCENYCTQAFANCSGIPDDSCN